MTDLGWALIGPGNWGRMLAAAMGSDRARLVGVLGATREESEAVAGLLQVRAFGSLDDVTSDPDIQAVVVATPNDNHAATAVICARAGKHIFCEKPMGLTVAECDSMIEAADAARVALSIGHELRLLPLLAEVRRLVRSGAIGEPVIGHMYRHEFLRRAPGSWLEQRARVGSILHQIGIHEIDWLRTVLGDVDVCFAQFGPTTIQRGFDFPDSVELSLRFRNGYIASLSTCISSDIPQYGGGIQGTEGAMAFEIHAGTLHLRSRAGTEEQRDGFAFGQGIEMAVRQEMNAFLDAATGRASPLVSGAEGRANIEVVQGALIAAAEDRPVSLPLPPEQRQRRSYLE